MKSGKVLGILGIEVRGGSSDYTPKEDRGVSCRDNNLKKEKTLNNGT